MTRGGTFGSGIYGVVVTINQYVISDKEVSYSHHDIAYLLCDRLILQ